MNDLAMDLVRLTRRNRDGALSSQANRRRGLVQLANQLYELGYKLRGAQAIKPKHVEALIGHWRSQGLSTGTIKNRMGWIRWWTAKVNKASILPRSNAALGIELRQAPDKNRAWRLSNQNLPKCPRMRCALQLMETFGLRFEEALKLRPQQADQGALLQLQASWTKGGRAREVPIHNEAQRAILRTAQELVGSNSLVPTALSYIQFRRRMEHVLGAAGLKNVHGLRHAYAQRRYAALTGWACPQCGGPTREQFTAQERRLDRQARLQVSRELGHYRLAITKVYLG